MQRASYRKSSPGYGEENDTRGYGFKLKIKKRKIVFVDLGPLQ